MICTHCNKNEVEIHIEEIGDFCLDCYNTFVSETYDIKTYDQYSKSLTVYDEHKKMYRFKITYELLPVGYCWKAKEVDGNYEFEVIADFDEDQQIIIKHLQSKIIKGITKKSLTLFKEEQAVTNAIHLDDKQYVLTNVGSLRIEVDDNNHAFVIIDGKRVSFEDFAETISSFEGFTMDYQFRDSSDEVLEEDMILRQFSINDEKLYELFEKRLNWFVIDNYLDMNREDKCIEALLETVDDIELSIRYGDEEKIIALANRIIERLNEVEYRGDGFPDYIVALIQNIVG